MAFFDLLQNPHEMTLNQIVAMTLTSVSIQIFTHFISKKSPKSDSEAEPQKFLENPRIFRIAVA